MGVGLQNVSLFNMTRIARVKETRHRATAAAATAAVANENNKGNSQDKMNGILENLTIEPNMCKVGERNSPFLNFLKRFCFFLIFYYLTVKND